MNRIKLYDKDGKLQSTVKITQSRVVTTGQLPKNNGKVLPTWPTVMRVALKRGLHQRVR